MQTVAQLTSFPTVDVIFGQMIQGLVNAGIPADKWRPGGVGRSILYVVATTYASLSTLITLFAGSAFLDTATGDWLTLLALKVYGVPRVQATFASGSITAVNGGGGLYTWLPGQLVVQDAVSLQTYANTAAVTLNPGATLSIAVQALIQGSTGNANPGEITILVTSAPGVTITNPIAVVGTDAATDASLRALCQAKLGALSMAGPRGAYAYAIQSAINASGAAVNLNRWSISPSSSTGQVQIYLASPSGPAASADVTGVQTNIEAVARPDTATANVASATTVAYSPSFTIWVRGTPGLVVPTPGNPLGAQTLVGIDAPTILALVQAALVANIATYPIGGVPKPPSTQGYLYDSEARGWCQSAHPAIYAVDSLYAADLALAPGQVAALVSPTISVRLVATAATS